MGIDNLISEIDAKIAWLNDARALLAGVTTTRKRGRPAKTAKAAKAVKAVKAAAKPAKAAKKKAKRNISPEGRARIAAAVKARWAKQKKAAAKPAKKAPAKKASGKTEKPVEPGTTQQKSE
jgi:hypothetical protein